MHIAEFTASTGKHCVLTLDREEGEKAHITGDWDGDPTPTEAEECNAWLLREIFVTATIDATYINRPTDEVERHIAAFFAPQN